MNNKFFLTIIILFLVTITAEAQSKQEKAVADATEQLRKAMIDGDKATLESLVDDKLSYGHSGGHIDDKKEFVEKLTSGKSDFVTIELNEQTVSVNKKLGIIRHALHAKTNDSGKPGEVHLLVLLVWQKVNGKWKLIARQAVKAA